MSCPKSGHCATLLLLMLHEKRNVSYYYLANFIIWLISVIRQLWESFHNTRRGCTPTPIGASALALAAQREGNRIELNQRDLIESRDEHLAHRVPIEHRVRDLVLQ